MKGSSSTSIVTENNVRVKTRTAQIPYPIVHSQMFIPTNTPETPYNREWIDNFGNKNKVSAPSTPTHFDMVNFVVFLHLAQQKFTVKEDMPDDYEDGMIRYKVSLNLQDFYEILSLPSNGSYRQNLDKSLEKLSLTSLVMNYAHPEKHNDNYRIVISSLIGDLIWTRKLGRGGNVLTAFPLKAMIDNRALTVDVDKLIHLKSPLAKVAAFYLQARQAVSLSWECWMQSIATGNSLKRFKEHFREALSEMRDVGYNVREEEDKIVIGRTVLSKEEPKQKKLDLN